MKRALGIRLRGLTDATTAIASEANALDRELSLDAELSVTEVTTEANILGAFQRGTVAPGDPPLVRRVSGGALVHVGAGTLHVALVLASRSSLVRCEPRTILNRYVRPLLRALTKSGAPASYFGRDWISVAHRPAASIGFAHDATTGRTVIEAFIAVRAPFSPPRASFLGKAPGSLESICGRSFDASEIARAIVDAYLAVGDREPRPLPPSDGALAGHGELAADPPWSACVEEAIGRVCAGRDQHGVMRLGGDFLASRDAIRKLEASVGSLGPAPDEDALGQAIDGALAAPGVALEGIRHLTNVRDVLSRAIAAKT